MVFRLDTDEVRIRRRGNRIVSELLVDGDCDWLDAVTGPVDEDYAAATLEQPWMLKQPESDDVIA